MSRKLVAHPARAEWNRCRFASRNGDWLIGLCETAHFPSARPWQPRSGSGIVATGSRSSASRFLHHRMDRALGRTRTCAPGSGGRCSIP